MLLFSVRDEKAETFGKVITDVTRGTAARAFGDYVLEEKSVFGAHPEDFSLYQIGILDELTGVLEAFEKPVRICSAVDFISKKK